LQIYGKQLQYIACCHFFERFAPILKNLTEQAKKYSKNNVKTEDFTIVLKGNFASPRQICPLQNLFNHLFFLLS